MQFFICSSSLLRCYGDVVVECCFGRQLVVVSFSLWLQLLQQRGIRCRVVSNLSASAPAVQRWSGEIVACISEDDEHALASKQASDRQVRCSCLPRL